MKNFTVSLFGHRELEDFWTLDEQLTRELENLVQTGMQISFLIGRNGEFDEFAASVIKLVQKRLERKT